MGNVLLISDAAKAVQVESHVLRYWEEELQLPIQRNEQGHRYYTDADVERFKKIKGMKESGLQLKAIKLILKNGGVGSGVGKEKSESSLQMAEAIAEERSSMQMGVGKQEMTGFYNPIGMKAVEEQEEGREQKAKRLQWIMQQLIRQAVQENNAELLQQIRESVIKELDYQFRMQEEREEERDRKAEERAELHYRQIDELIRQKAGRKKTRGERKREQRRARECEQEEGQAAEQLRTQEGIQGMQDMQSVYNMQSPQNIQNMQNPQNMQNVHNMQSPHNMQNVHNMQSQQNMQNPQNIQSQQQNMRNLQNIQAMRNVKNMQEEKNLQLSTAGGTKGQKKQNKILQMQGRRQEKETEPEDAVKEQDAATEKKRGKKKFLFL